MRETRAAYATRMFRCFYDWRAQEICREELFTEAEIVAARQEAWRQKDALELECIVYGRPEYGGRAA